MSVSQVHRQFQSLPGKDLRLRGLVKDLRNGHLGHLNPKTHSV